MIQTLIDNKIASNNATIQSLLDENKKLENQSKNATKQGMQKWLDYEFESSSGLTEEFASFYKELKKELQKMLGNEFEIEVNRGHFEAHGFVKNKLTGKYAYFSFSDVRYWQNEWYENILVRTAKDNKDFTGGSNQYSSFENLKARISMLTL